MFLVFHVAHAGLLCLRGCFARWVDGCVCVGGGGGVLLACLVVFPWGPSGQTPVWRGRDRRIKPLPCPARPVTSLTSSWPAL